MNTVNLHFIEIGHFGDVDQVEDGKIFHFLRNAVQHFVHFHTSWIPIVTESDDLKEQLTQNIQLNRH